VEVSKGCHTAPFFSAQQPPSLRFLAEALTGPGDAGAASRDCRDPGFLSHLGCFIGIWACAS